MLEALVIVMLLPSVPPAMPDMPVKDEEMLFTLTLDVAPKLTSLAMIDEVA